MSDYSKTTNFTAKDALSSGDPNKIIKGSEHDTEFDNIASMSTTKTNKVASPTSGNVAELTGTGDISDGGFSFPNLVGAVFGDITEFNKLNGLTSNTSELNILDGALLNVTELNYVNGVTSDIQTQLDEKATDIFSITGTVATSSLIVGLDITDINFRSSIITNGSSVQRNVPSVISVVVPSGATLGTTDTVQSRIALIAIDNAGTIELAVINPTGGWELNEDTLISTTAISTAADSEDIFYSTTARSDVAFRVVGYIESTQAVAGTWDTSPSTLQGGGGNVSFGFLGALAGLSSVSDAEIDADSVGDSELKTTIGLSGTQSINSNGTWTPAAGFYNIVQTSGSGGNLGLEIQTSTVWRTPTHSGINGLVWFDGTNMRIKEIDGINGATLYWQKLG